MQRRFPSHEVEQLEAVDFSPRRPFMPSSGQFCRVGNKFLCPLSLAKAGQCITAYAALRGLCRTRTCYPKRVVVRQSIKVSLTRSTVAPLYPIAGSNFPYTPGHRRIPETTQRVGPKIRWEWSEALLAIKS